MTALPDPQAEALSLRRRLRAESRASHEELDARFEGMAEAERPDIYSRFLRVNEACHGRIEPILARSPLEEAAPGFRLTPRTPSLRRDLAAMDLSPIDPPAFPIPEPDTAEVVGIVYVVEGSRLGAGFILARLRERALGPEWANVSFAYLEGPEEPHALRGFLSKASASLHGEDAIFRAVSAANATFRYFLAVERLSRAGDLS